MKLRTTLVIKIRVKIFRMMCSKSMEVCRYGGDIGKPYFTGLYRATAFLFLSTQKAHTPADLLRTELHHQLTVLLALPFEKPFVLYFNLRLYILYWFIKIHKLLKIFLLLNVSCTNICGLFRLNGILDKKRFLVLKEGKLIVHTSL